MVEGDTCRMMGEDIVSSKSAYALLGSLAVGLMMWGGAFALLI